MSVGSGLMQESTICLISSVSESGLADIEIRVTPNPTSGLLSMTNLRENEGVRITVYNILGELVLDQLEKPSNGLILDISLLPDGLYILLVMQDQTTYKKKVVKF